MLKLCFKEKLKNMLRLGLKGKTEKKDTLSFLYIKSIFYKLLSTLGNMFFFFIYNASPKKEKKKKKTC